MSAVRFAALGDSLTEGVGDPVDGGWRGWAALLAPALAPAVDKGGAVADCAAGESHRSGRGVEPAAPAVELAAGRGEAVVCCAAARPERSSGIRVEFRNFAVSGAQTRDVLEEQLPKALCFAPHLASVVVGVNDTLRRTFDIHHIATRLDEICDALSARGTRLLTACLPDPGMMLGLPGPLARPLARRQQAVNAVVHAVSQRYDAVHLHAADDAWVTDRQMWSADRLHPGERGHRFLAARFHELLAATATPLGTPLGDPPSYEPEHPTPTRSASLLWLATAGTGWVARRCTDLLPQLLRLAATETRHHYAGTSALLDLHSERATAAALGSLASMARMGG